MPPKTIKYLLGVFDNNSHSDTVTARGATSKSACSSDLLVNKHVILNILWRARLYRYMRFN